MEIVPMSKIAITSIFRFHDIGTIIPITFIIPFHDIGTISITSNWSNKHIDKKRSNPQKQIICVNEIVILEEEYILSSHSKETISMTWMSSHGLRIPHESSEEDKQEAELIRITLNFKQAELSENVSIWENYKQHVNWDVKHKKHILQLVLYSQQFWCIKIHAIDAFRRQTILLQSQELISLKFHEGNQLNNGFRTVVSFYNWELLIEMYNRVWECYCN